MVQKSRELFTLLPGSLGAQSPPLPRRRLQGWWPAAADLEVPRSDGERRSPLSFYLPLQQGISRL